MFLSLLQFFDDRKMRTIAYGEPEVLWNGGGNTLFSIIFYENNHGKRKYTVEQQNYQYGHFHYTHEHIHCETWIKTGLLPSWAKDPIAEKLVR